MTILHLGCKIQDKASNHINKELYLAAKPEGLQGWTEEHYIRQRPKADLNYDLNMAYFDSHDFEEFDKYIVSQCEKFKLKQCLDLNELKGVSGVYVMVLDDYKQVYIGKADDMKRRILQHWNKRKSLERLIFGDICNSILSVDSFGALDTTRVFYIKTYNTYKTEEKIVRRFASGYMLNRVAGGIGGDETNSELGVKFALLGSMKNRNLLQFVDFERLKSVVSEKELEYYLDRYPCLKDK